MKAGRAVATDKSMKPSVVTLFAFAAILPAVVTVMIVNHNRAASLSKDSQNLQQSSGPTVPAISVGSLSRSQYDKTVTELEAQNPKLNPDSPSFVPELTQGVMRQQWVYVQSGIEETAALRRAVSDFRAQEAAEERLTRDAAEQARQYSYQRMERLDRRLFEIQAAHDAAVRQRAEETDRASQISDASQRLVRQLEYSKPRVAHQMTNEAPVAPPPQPEAFQPPPRGTTNVTTGEFLAPIGPNFVGTRNGTVFVPAGPNGLINTRTGRFVPTF